MSSPNLQHIAQFSQPPHLPYSPPFKPPPPPFPSPTNVISLQNVDSRYKTIVMEASQNIDRSDRRTQKIGITGCLTPGMVPYVGIRGGPF